MAGYGDGGTVAVQLVLFGTQKAEKKLTTFQRRTKVAMEKAKRVAINFGKSFSKSILQATASLAKFAIQAAAIGGALFLANSFRTGINNAVSLDRSLALLNRTLGEGGQEAALYARNLGKLYGTGITKTVKAFSQFSAAATAAGVSLELQKDVFEQTTKAGIAFGLSQEQTGRAFQALQQIASKGVASMEELRQQLGEQVPIALAATAEGAGITAKALIDLISSGDLSSKDFFEFYAKGMERFTKGADSADIASQAINKFKTAWEGLNLVFTESILPEIVQLMKDLVPLMDGVGSFRQAQRVTGGNIGLFGPIKNTLGQQSRADKAVLGFQEYLSALGYTADQSNALITDAVKDVKGSAYKKRGIAPLSSTTLNIFNDEDARAVSDRLSEIVVERMLKGIDPRSIAARAQSAEDKKIADAEAAAKLAQQEEEIAKVQKDAARYQTEQAQKRLSIATSIVSNRIGGNAGSAFGAVGELKLARDLAREANKNYNQVRFKNDPVAAAKAEIEAARAQEAYLAQGQASALAIQDAFTNASEQAKKAAEAVSEAKTNLGDILVDPEQGVGKYLSRGGQKRQAESGRQLLLARAREIKRGVLPTIAGSDRASFNANTRLSSFSTSQLQDFIKNAGGELEAQRALTKANQDLTKANHELSEVMKLAADNQTPLIDSNSVLTNTINELVNKNWTVNVDVPGGSASGDVVALQNALQ